MILPRFYPILDTRVVRARGLDPVDCAVALMDCGVRILQIRHKGDWDAAAFDMAQGIATHCIKNRVLLVVNDRADIARMLDAALHVGQRDLPPASARRIIGDLPLGFSTHNEAQFRDALDEPADYLALGPIYGTASKENPDPVVGTAEFARLRPLSSRPVVAIGGIVRAHAREVLDAGADSIAVIGDLFPAASATLTDLRTRADEWMRATS